MLFLGIDTSNYTTSVALVDAQGVIADVRKVLEVEQGKRGLQQSQALFQHWQVLPTLLEQVFAQLGDEKITAVGVSTRPRDVEGSYMPVFGAGNAAARIISSGHKIPLYTTDHQHGHLLAGMGNSFPDDRPFLALHLSGGTTELLRVERFGVEHKVEIVGGTEDLNAGQFVDRVGVALGLQFPAGKELEKLAAQGSGKLSFPPSVKGSVCSFSGVETKAQRSIRQGEPAEEVAYAVQECIAETLRRIILSACEEYGLTRVLAVGGVASNIRIRTRLKETLNAKRIEVFYAPKELSRDNAVGVAYYAQRRWSAEGCRE